VDGGVFADDGRLATAILAAGLHHAVAHGGSTRQLSSGVRTSAPWDPGQNRETLRRLSRRTARPRSRDVPTIRDCVASSNSRSHLSPYDAH